MLRNEELQNRCDPRMKLPSLHVPKRLAEAEITNDIEGDVRTPGHHVHSCVRVVRCRVLGDTIELLDPAAEILRHVVFEGVYCTRTESMRYNLALSPMIDTVAYVEHTWYS